MRTGSGGVYLCREGKGRWTRRREDHSQPQSVSCPYYLTQSLRHRLFPVPMIPRRALPLRAARSLGRLVSREAPFFLTNFLMRSGSLACPQMTHCGPDQRARVATQQSPERRDLLSCSRPFVDGGFSEAAGVHCHVWWSGCVAACWACAAADDASDRLPYQLPA